MRKENIVFRYRGAKWSTRFFLTARWKLTPYSHMASRLPEKGKVLDLGCGHGLFALAAGLSSSSRKIVGIDHDSERISLGLRATQDLPNIQLKEGSLTQPSQETQSYSAVTMIDVMHYFDPRTQDSLIQNAYQLLERGGTLLVREVDPQAGLTSVWNRFYEKIATGIGFTRAEKSTLHFRTRSAWEDLMKKNGFQVRSERCSSFLFADILYICERPKHS
jgi:ubiquinone/menaquinone biosynthesis C-methylase UbiE